MRHTKHSSTLSVRALAFLLTTGAFIASCDRSEQEDLAPGSGNAGNGTPAAFSIRLQGTPGYSDTQTGTRSAGNGEPLIAEWVKVSSFDATRPVTRNREQAAEGDGGPRIALMELTEDTGSARPATRGVMPAGYTFRVIAFLKTGGGYEFQSVADYASKGGNVTPELTGGEIYLSVGQTYRFVAYSFNNTKPIADPVTKRYDWNSTPVEIPDLNNDFMTYDSGDRIITDKNFTLPVSFNQQLCKLTVKISATGFADNAFTNCTGVYIEQGGNLSSWTPGASGVTASTNNSDPFTIPDNSTTTFVRLVPFASARTITVHFGTLTVGGKDAGNTDITSAASVQLKPGKSYTLTAQFKKSIGINVPVGNITMSYKKSCKQADKETLSKLLWAEGNLIGTGTPQANDYAWTSSTTGYGDYYTYLSTYTGDTSTNGIDPCTKLKPGIYGTGWYTPTYEEILSLTNCTNKKPATHKDGTKGMWFMNPTSGLFLPFAGARGGGSGTSAMGGVGNATKEGYYWSQTIRHLPSSDNPWMLRFASTNNYAEPYDQPKTYGGSVRCVKKLPK